MTGRSRASELLEQVRSQAVAFLTAVPQPPRALRIRAHAVELDAEWADVTRTGTAGEDVPAVPGHTAITAATVGVFYAAPQPGAPPFVRPGEVVTAGQQVAIIETMKLMIPVEATRPGRIVKVLKENGESVAYGDALFAVAPDDVG
nr:TamJ [uncultured bacterium]